MIELMFNIKSYYYDKNKDELLFKEYEDEKISFNENLKFKEVLKKIYKNYGIEKDIFYKTNWYIKYDLDVVDYNEFFWKQYFNEKIYYNLEYTFGDYKNKTLEELEIQFHISKFYFPILLNFQGGRGAGVAEKEGIKFFFHTNEKNIHHKPHIHCKYSGEEMRIDLVDDIIIDKPFKTSKKSKIALEFCKQYKKELIDYWDKVVINGEYIKFEIEY